MDYMEYLLEHWPYTWCLAEATHLEFVVGSRGWGLSTPDSDHDVLLVVIPPVEATLGFDNFSSWSYKDETVDAKVYSLTKFVTMLTKASPNAIQTLWLNESFRKNTVFTKFVLDNKDKLITRQTVNTLLIAANSINKAGEDNKSSAHATRLLLFARDMLQSPDTLSSTLNDKQIKMVSRILSGEYTPQEFTAIFVGLHEFVSMELNESTLPQRIDVDFWVRKLIETLRIFI